MISPRRKKERSILKINASIKDTGRTAETGVSKHYPLEQFISGVGAIALRFERGVFKNRQCSGLARCPRISDAGPMLSLPLAQGWFDLLLTPLDCYTWVFGEGLLLPTDMFPGSGTKGSSTLFASVRHFLEDLALKDLAAAGDLFSEKKDDTFYTPWEREEYNRAKCTVIVRFMNFLCTILAKQPKEIKKVIPSSLWSESLWEVMVGCLFRPADLGFNMANMEVTSQLPRETETLLMLFRRHLPDDLMKGLKKSLTKQIANHSLLSLVPEDLANSSTDAGTLVQILRGYQQLQHASLLVGCLPAGQSASNVAAALLDKLMQGITTKQDGELTMVSLTPSGLDLAHHIMQLAFDLGLDKDAFLDCLCDKTKVKHAGLSNDAALGETMFTQFRSTITPCLVSSAAEFVPLLMTRTKRHGDTLVNILGTMLDHIVRDKHLRKSMGATVVRLILRDWSAVSSWWQKSASMENKAQALSLLAKVIMVDSKLVGNVKEPSFQDVFEMYLHMLTDSTTNLGFKSRVLDLLVFFSDLPDKQLTMLKERLDRLIADNFPMRSSEFTIGTAKYNEYINAINKVLSAMELSGSRMLLELVLSIMCREEKHAHEDQIQHSLAAFIERMPRAQQKLALDVPFSVFNKQEGFPTVIRRAAMERVCLSMLRLVHVASLNEFFMDHIKEIMAVIDAKTNRSSESAHEQQLVSKLGCFQLLEVLYSRLPKDDVSSKNSRINAVYCNNAPESGKELTQNLTKAAHAAKSEDMRGETELRELRRQYHCAAYDALVAVISCTQSDVKFYNAFLFSDTPAKGKFLWENIIDLKRQYTFEIEMSDGFERKKKFVAIRSEVREQDRERVDDGTTSVHYLASAYLHDSSLSQDVSHFDFGTSASASVFSSSSSLPGRGRGRKQKNRDQNMDEPAVVVSSDYIEMEMDALNQHECMASLTALLNHMQHNKITPEVEKGTSPTTMPDWMNNLHRKMQSSTTEINIKLFLAKLIINTHEVFRPYARFWLSPIVQLIVSGQTGSPGVHYLIVDLVVTILSWHTFAIPEDTSVDRAMASRLCEFLMENCYHDTRRVLRNNLEVIKTLVEVWKERITVPTSVIYGNLSKPDPKSTANATGVQLLGVVLTNKLPPYVDGCGVDKDRFFQALAKNLTHQYKAVYAAAAEVVGMTLSYMVKQGAGDKGWLDGYLNNIVKMLLSLQQGRPDVFVACIHHMALHYAPAADRFLSKLLFLLPRLHGDSRMWCLQILESRLTQVDDAFLELKNKGILRILEHRDEGAQLAALNLVMGMCPALKATEMLYLVPSVAVFAQHHSQECRQAMYEIFMWIYDNYREEPTEEAYEIMTVTKNCLLHGLSDEDARNRLLVQNFWSDGSRLPVGTVERLVAMLEAMYAPSSELAYLAYATNLILSMTSQSPDYNKHVFEHPLDECRFESYQVHSSWRHRHAAMTPLFVETLASQESSLDSLGQGHVRATQDVQQFTPTQQPGGGGKGLYDWLTQSSLDTYASYTLPSFSSESQASALLFTVGRADKPKPPTGGHTHAPVGPDFGKSQPAASGSRTVAAAKEANEQSDILRLKRRFIKDKQGTASYFMKRSSRINKLRQDMLKEQKARRENQVTMYRRYRLGDLPDVQISHAALIAPLQALAQRDSNVARLLFSAIFRAIFLEIENVKTDRESRETFDQISTSLNQMLSTSTHYCPSFVGSILDIAYEFPRKLKLDATSVNTACVTSMQQPLGILVLEEMLIRSTEEEEKPTKRARLSTPAAPKDTSTWIEVARLYKSLGDYDMLRGIFSSRIGTQELTSKAMDAEMRGDYYAALLQYNEGISTDWTDEKPSQMEEDFWEQGQLQCCAQLTRWDKLQDLTGNIIQNIAGTSSMNLGKVWDDTYLQEQVLPLMIRCRLKRMLTDDSDQQPLLGFIDASMKVPDRKAFLESRHCEELALMYLWQEDYDRARYYTRLAIERFLQTWSYLGVLMTDSRLGTLQSLQQLTELKEFLDFINKEGNMKSSVPMDSLIHKWLGRQPDPILDPVSSVWDDVITNRCVYLYQAGKLYENKGVSLAMTMDGEAFCRERVTLELLEAESASLQDNFSVANKILKKLRPEVNALTDEHLTLKWLHASSRNNNRLCEVGNVDTVRKVTTLTDNLDRLGSHVGSATLQGDPCLHQKHCLLLGRTLHILTGLMQTGDVAIDDLDAKVGKAVSKAALCDGKEKDKIISGLVERGFNELTLATKVGIKSEIKGASNGIGSHHELDLSSQEAHLTLVKYCDHYLRQTEDDDGADLKWPSGDAFPVTMVTSLLTAMRQGSAEARQRFPRLLQIVALYPDTMKEFLKQSSTVPAWMFLSWISQMTALLDKPESAAVQDALLNLVHLYPEAVIYPFKMSCEGYVFEDNAVGRKGKEVNLKIQDQLSRKPMVTAFISALEQFGQPNALFKDWIDDVIKLTGPKPQSRDKEAILKSYREMYTALLDVSRESSEDLYETSQDSASIPSQVGMGPYRRKFAVQFCKHLDAICGKGGKNLLSMPNKEFHRKVSELYKTMDAAVKEKNLAPPGSLTQYCPWLAEFQANRYDEELELPGQYTGQSKPMPEYHVKISSFDETVLVMSSIRKPKRLKIRGNDELEYCFLVKGGEDLRLDQRIEQLFAIMNDIFQQDAACKQRHLQLRTYQVIPMTPRVGMIEWMDHTTPLKSFLYDALTEDESQFILSNRGPHVVHSKWVGANTPASYQDMYKKCNRSDTVTNFRRRQDLIPWDLSKRAYMQMSCSLEAFFVLRNNFARTHALVSICQYILGIGDRHLSNFMIDELTGSVVGIDFGHAFGSATQFLPIPELMPFRLTRQLRNLCLPLKEKGLMEGTMIHALRAMRHHSDLLLATMDVFIKEPSLDWQANAAKQRKTMSEDEIDSSWYPKEKVAYARKKLEGHNPASITKSELALGHAKAAAYTSMVRVIQGERDLDIRARCPETGLTVEQQVACLLNQATDPNILGRVWVGWESWM